MILDAGPTVGVPADGSADLELRSPSGVVSFDRAEGPRALTDTELMVDLEGGEVAKVTFRTPRSVAAGSERVLARWTAVTSSDQPVSVWAAVAIEGLPDGCELEGVARWEQLGEDIGRVAGTRTPAWTSSRARATCPAGSSRRARRVRRRAHAGPAQSTDFVTRRSSSSGSRSPSVERLDRRSPPRADDQFDQVEIADPLTGVIGDQKRVRAR